MAADCSRLLLLTAAMGDAHALHPRSSDSRQLQPSGRRRLLRLGIMEFGSQGRHDAQTA